MNIYKSRAEDVIPPPKVELGFPSIDFEDLLYPRLKHQVLEPGPRDTLFCLVHGLYRSRARLFRQNRATNPNCPVPECQNAVQDIEHIFCSCSRVVEAWLWLRNRLLQLMAHTIGGVATSSEEFILLQYQKDTQDKECIWLIGNYVEIVNNEVVAKNRMLKKDQLRGILRGRLQEMASRSVVQPLILNI